MPRRRGRARRPAALTATPDADAGPAYRRRPDAVNPDDGKCALCERAVERFTVHHLIPRARGGSHGPTARFCPTCHRQVHAMFSETTLAEELYSVELLRANDRVAAFLQWMRKQRGAAFKVRRARERG